MTIPSLNSVNLKLKASVLLQVLVVAVVLAVFMVALITISYYSNMLFTRDAIQERLNGLVKSSLAAVISNPSIDSFAVSLALAKDKEDTLMIVNKTWGFWNICGAKAYRHFQNDTMTSEKVGLIGATPDILGKSAVYLQENAKSLIVAGNTKITGYSFLPRAGIKTGYVGINGFEGAKILYGEERKSSRLMPEIDRKMAENIISIGYSTISKKQIPKKANASFINKTEYFRNKR